MDTVKQLWGKFTGKTDTDEIDEVLKEQSTQSGIQELLETLKETRIFKLGMEVMENLNIEKLGLDSIDFSNIENLIEMVKNPEHPVTKKAAKNLPVPSLNIRSKSSPFGFWIKSNVATGLVNKSIAIYAGSVSDIALGLR